MTVHNYFTVLRERKRKKINREMGNCPVFKMQVSHKEYTSNSISSVSLSELNERFRNLLAVWRIVGVAYFDNNPTLETVMKSLLFHKCHFYNVEQVASLCIVLELDK